MEISEIKSRIHTFLVDEFEVDEALITDDASLKEDMGIDSLEIVDVVVLVESEFGVKIKSEDFKILKTFSQLAEYIHSKTNA